MVFPLICGEKTLKNKKGKSSDSLVMLSVESLEVELIMGILQDFSIRFNEEVCPLAETKVIGKAG